MKILRILVDKIPNEKEYCKFCTVLDDTQENFCSVTEQKCGAKCCLTTPDEFKKDIGRAVMELLKPAVDSMREIIKEYEAMNKDVNNENNEKA